MIKTVMLILPASPIRNRSERGDDNSAMTPGGNLLRVLELSAHAGGELEMYVLLLIEAAGISVTALVSLTIADGGRLLLIVADRL
jgi:hypothetical protein